MNLFDRIKYSFQFHFRKLLIDLDPKIVIEQDWSKFSGGVWSIGNILETSMRRFYG